MITKHRFVKILLASIILLGCIQYETRLVRAIPNGGITELISVASDGTQGNGGTQGFPAISADCRYVAFESLASNLVEGDTNYTGDIFVHDLNTKETSLISISSEGIQGYGHSLEPSISADGRYVAFTSWSWNLVVGDTNLNPDIFVHDRVTGETTRVSVASDGTQANGYSSKSSISGDGRYVVFESSASNLVNGHYGGIFLHDRVTGQTTVISANEEEGTQNSFDVSISFDGRYVSFSSGDYRWVEGDTNENVDIFVLDRVTGEATRVSVASDWTEANGESKLPNMSSDGRYVTFTSYASNLVENDTNGYHDIFVHDRFTGETTRASVASDETQANRDSYYPSISNDGNYVIFETYASNLVEGDSNNVTDVFMHNRITGETIRTTIAYDGMDAASGGHYGIISADGECVAFESGSTDIVINDTNDSVDVFVHYPEDDVPGEVDLDVAESEVKRALSIYDVKQTQPYTTTIETSLVNHGPDIATNVNIEFFDGHPSSGTLITSTIIESVGVGEIVPARAVWTVSSTPTSANIYVKVSATESDTNTSNNISSQGTPAYIAFAADSTVYAYDPDTFNFPNWNMKLEDLIVVMGSYLPFSDDEYPYIFLPMFFYNYLTKAGHCYGMSQASIIYWDTPTVKPIPADTFTMDQLDVTLDINDHQIRQVIPLYWNIIKSYLITNIYSPTNAYQDARDRLSGTPSNPAIFIFWVGEGHSIVAYKVVEIGGEQVLYFYDNNDPMPTDGTIEPPTIGRLEPSNNQFTIQTHEGPLLITQALVTDPVRDPSEITAEMILDIYEYLLENLVRNDILSGYFAWGSNTLDAMTQSMTQPTNFLIQDSLGNRLGYDGGVLVQEISGAEWNESDTTFSWMIPAEGEYTLEFEGTGTSGAVLSYAIPLNVSQVQEIVFTGFDLPNGAIATTSFSQETTEWAIEIDGQPDILPTVEQLTRVDVLIMLPMVVK